MLLPPSFQMYKCSCNSVKDEERVNDGCSLILARTQFRFYLNSTFGVQGKALTCGPSSSLGLSGMLALSQQPGRKSSCETGEILESTPKKRCNSPRELTFHTIHSGPRFSFQRFYHFCGFLIIFQQVDDSLQSIGRSVLAGNDLIWTDKFLRSLLFCNGAECLEQMLQTSPLGW